MNNIRRIQALNDKEIENNISPGGSWHVDYRDTAFVYFGGLPYDFSEGDIITIFSQYGEPVFLKLVRDKESGKSKGFGWLKYEDQRSADLAVDNLCGAEIGGRALNVDHARYEARDDENAGEFKVGWQDVMKKEGQSLSDEESDDDEPQRPMLQEEVELAKLIQDHDEDDPMKAFLIEEKKKEVEEARRRADKKEKKHRHRHHRSHRSRRDGSDDDNRQRKSFKTETSHGEERHRRENGSRRDRKDRNDSREDERRHRRRDDNDEGDDRSRRRDNDRDRGRRDRDHPDRERERRRRHKDEDERPKRERQRSRSPRRSDW